MNATIHIRDRIPERLRSEFDTTMSMESMYGTAQSLFLNYPEERSFLAPIMSDIILHLFPAYENATRLFRDGYVVMPVLDEYATKQWRDEIKRNIQSFPEYRDPSYPVLGGFAALGNPASFHHTDIRGKRHYMYNHIRSTLLRDYAIITGQEEELRSELLFDRIMWRRAGQKPSKESWHRDVTVKPPKSSLRPEDVIFGGWLNLDDVDQYFSCVPGTHLDTDLYHMNTTGFSKLPKDQHAMCKAKSARISIPAGHCIVFFQHILHEVVGLVAKQDMFRLFHGFRLTYGERPLFHDDYVTRKVFENQAIPRLPSFQKPPMYSANHYSAFLGLPQKPYTSRELVGKFTLPGQTVKTNTILWSQQTFHPNSLVTKTRTIKGDPGADMEYIIVPRHMNSLAQDGYTLYDAYTPGEREHYTPTLLIRYEDEKTRSNAESTEEEEKRQHEGEKEQTIDELQQHLINIKKHIHGQHLKTGDTVTITGPTTGHEYSFTVQKIPLAAPDARVRPCTHFDLYVYESTSSSGKPNYLAVSGKSTISLKSTKQLPSATFVHSDGREQVRPPKFMGRFYYYQDNDWNRAELTSLYNALLIVNTMFTSVNMEAPFRSRPQQYGILNWEVDCTPLPQWIEDLTARSSSWDPRLNPALRPDGTVLFCKNGVHEPAVQDILNHIAKGDRMPKKLSSVLYKKVFTPDTFSALLNESEQHPGGVRTMFASWGKHARLIIIHHQTVYLMDPWMPLGTILVRPEQRRGLDTLQRLAAQKGYTFQFMNHMVDQARGEGSCVLATLARMFMICRYGMPGTQKPIECDLAILTYRLVSMFRKKYFNKRR